MSKYNPKIHKRRSIRLKGYDYSQQGLYFITICCRDKIHFFGEIVDGKMMLNEIGKLAKQCWLDIPNHFLNVSLHPFVIMPNHIHGIIEIKSNIHDIPIFANVPVGAKDFSPNNHINYRAEDFSPNNHINYRAEDFSPNNHINYRAEDFPPLQITHHIHTKNSTSKTIGSIVRGFKIGVTKWVRQHTEFYDIWQRNYHDHIIRNETSYLKICEYIENNPLQWELDCFYSP